MKTASYGRILFGVSAVLFGVIALMWHDPETWQTMRRIWSLPFGTSVGEALMVAQIAGGIGTFFRQTVRPAAILLVVVYSLFALACVPSIVAAPAAFGSYDSFFEQFCLLCGAIAVYAATDRNEEWSATLGGAVRIGLGLCAISFTLAQVFYLRDTASLVPAWIPPNQMFWAILTTIAFGLAAIAMLVNRRARLAINLMALMIALFGLLVWIPLLVAHPASHFSWSEFALTCLIAGASRSIAELQPAR